MSMKSNPRRPRRIQLAERDERVVRLVHELGIATVEHVQLLEFGEKNRSRAQTRLSVLRQVGYLETLPGRTPNAPAVWVATRRAIEAFGLPRAGEAGPVRRVKYGRLNHDLAVNDCRVQFMRACREPGLELLSWRDEETLRPTTIRHGVLPDALFQIERNDGEHRPKSTFALECEVSEKGERALKQKYANFGAYYYGGRFEQDFGTKALRVLVLIRPSAGGSGERLVRRMTNLAKLVGVTFVRLAELEAFLKLPPAELFLRPIWSQPGVDGIVSLFPGGDSHASQQVA
jgi:hypothetical protein